MRLQTIEAKRRGKNEYVRLGGPATPDVIRPKVKEFKRSRESAEFESVLVMEKIGEVRLSKPKPAATKPK
jgi:hypothetical protein